MNKAIAWRFIVAARDDPVLAAWASVCDGYCPAVAADISPYDAWDAYQYLFNYGFVSAAQFDRTDIKKRFFSGHPSTYEIQEVLERARFLCPEHEPTPMETAMANENPFFSDDTSIATRKSHSSGNGLAAKPRSQSLGNPFSTKQEVIPQRQDEGLGLEAFAPRKEEVGLECQRDVGMTTQRALGQPRVYCGDCEAEVNMREDGGQRIPGDDEYGELSLTVFCGECCDKVFHISVAKDSHPDQY